VDYVIAEKHGEQMALDYLALAGTVCHRRKGSDIGSVFLSDISRPDLIPTTFFSRLHPLPCIYSPDL
jgi:hypothetical protein